MRNYVPVFFLFLTSLLIACQQDSSPIDKIVPTSTSTTQPLQSLIAPPTATVTSLPTETPPPLPTSATAETGIPRSIPGPSLFDISWSDRTLFAEGLLADESDVLALLPGAAVYHMQLEIDEDLKNISGKMEVRFTNQEQVDLTDVYFRLYPNILGGSLEAQDITLDGEPAVSQLSTADTLLRIVLKESLRPGQQVVIGMKFDVVVPETQGSSYGMFILQEEILALAHFYPIISVYDDEGWELALPSEQGDIIYADSSYYLVELTTPAGFVTATSGVTIERVVESAETTELVAAGPMRDFYIAGSYRFEHQSEIVDGVTVNSYAFPEFSEASNRVLDYGAEATAILSSDLGQYPFAELDIVSTPTRALGIEYPGIVVIALRMYGPDNPFGETTLESTVAHEVAHQWFYSMVGNDQLNDPWLDESLTQYATSLYYAGRYGAAGQQGFLRAMQARFDNSGVAQLPIGLAADAYTPAEYSGIVYGLGPLFFVALEEEIGVDEFALLLRDYVARNRFMIATPEEFQALSEQYCDCDLTPLFVEWIYGD